MTRPLLRQPARAKQEAPFLVIWEVTRACDLACQHCRAAAVPEPDPGTLTTAQGRRLLEQVAEFGRPYPLLVFTGGDPFKRADLFELVEYAEGLGLVPSVSPAATPLLTRERLARLAGCGARAVSLSLDGATASSHDDFRRVPGSFETTLAGARMVREAGLKLQINTTVTRQNVQELGDILRLVADLGVLTWSVFFLVPTGRGRALEEISPSEAEAVMHFLAQAGQFVGVKTTEGHHYKRVLLQGGSSDHPLYVRLMASLQDLPRSRSAGRTPMHINSGSGFVFVSDLGEVCPSGFLPLSGGNVRHRSLVEIYRQAPLFLALRDPERLTGRCGRCEFREVCGGSRARAFAAGDIWGDDPLCGYQPGEGTGCVGV